MLPPTDSFPHLPTWSATMAKTFHAGQASKLIAYTLTVVLYWRQSERNLLRFSIFDFESEKRQNGAIICTCL
jgi:hypothetical protein